MHINKRQRGRPRKNRPTIDLGTKELQQKRKTLLNTGATGDSALAESLLGVLYGRQLISKPLYEAGVFFGELGYRFEPCLDHKFRQNSSSLCSKKIDNQGGSPLYWSQAQDEKRTVAWYKALEALQQAGRGPYKVVLYVVFYDQDLYTVPVPQSIATVIQPLRKGLESLEIYFKGALRGGRGKHYDRGLNPGKSTRFQPFLKAFQSSFPP